MSLSTAVSVVLLTLCVVADGAASTKDYASALGKSILFYDAQRSGKLPANNPIAWREDSALNDCVPGGWYDAGDMVKFGLPLSFAAEVLTWSAIQFKDAYVKAGQLDMMYDMIKWPLDYFLKAWDPNAQELVVQIGDGNADHSYWGRPADMTMARPCAKAGKGKPASDIAGGTAAAMAAGALLFKDKGDASYANQLLQAAESLYQFGMNNRGIYKGAQQFYMGSNDTDRLCEAGMWLYKATGKQQYLDQSEAFYDVNNTYSWAYGWADIKTACHLHMYEVTKNDTYRQQVEDFFTTFPSDDSGNKTYTPCGMAWRNDWGSNRYAGDAAFLALVAAEAGINTDAYRKFAVEQINYLLGDNNHDGGCFSYMVGYGDKFPRQPHHRAASCPDKPAQCTWDAFNNPGPNPQIIQGALVGGPDKSGNYQDKRSNFQQNEVAIDYNSGMQGALAGIVHLEVINAVPATNNKCPCKSTFTGPDFPH